MPQPARPASVPAQTQDERPGRTAPMRPAPQDRMEGYRPAGKLEGLAALVTGGDSGIGRAVAVGFAKEGADVAIVYLKEDDDAKETVRLIEEEGRKVVALRADVGSASACRLAVDRAADALGRLDILVNNAGELQERERLEDLPEDQLRRTFATNIFGMFHMAQFALRHLRKGACIINTASSSVSRGYGTGVDYAASKGAVVSFTLSLSQQLAERGIRVNAVAPGPIWTPLIPSSLKGKDVKELGKDTLLGRPGQPDEVAPCYLFLASAQDSSYMTGQVLCPDGGLAPSS